MKNVGQFLSKTGTLLGPNKCEGGPPNNNEEQTLSKIQSLTRKKRVPCVNNQLENISG